MLQLCLYPKQCKIVAKKSRHVVTFGNYDGEMTEMFLFSNSDDIVTKNYSLSLEQTSLQI